MISQWDKILGLQTSKKNNLWKDLAAHLASESVSTESAETSTDKKIYIFLTIPKAGSGFWSAVGGAIQHITNSVYMHAGISTDRDLKTTYDISGQFGDNSFRVGDFTTFRDDLGVDKVDVYSISISESQFKAFQSTLNFFIKKSKGEGIKYDIGALVAALVGWSKNTQDEIEKMVSKGYWKDRASYICSAWVVGILAMNIPQVKNYMRDNALKFETFAPGSILNLPGIVPEWRYDHAIKRKVTIPTEIIKSKGAAR